MKYLVPTDRSDDTIYPSRTTKPDPQTVFVVLVDFRAELEDFSRRACMAADQGWTMKPVSEAAIQLGLFDDDVYFRSLAKFSFQSPSIEDGRWTNSE